jgi:hypothetical protein
MNKITVTCIIEEGKSQPNILTDTEGPPMNVFDLARAYGLMISAINHSAMMVRDALPNRFREEFRQQFMRGVQIEVTQSSGGVITKEVTP